MSVCPYPVVAAIDFGTHGTGYAWVEVVPDDFDDIRRPPQFRRQWPGSRDPRPKTLTALLLDRYGAVREWGYAARNEWRDLSTRGEHAGWTYVSDFKMALKPDAFRGMTPPGLGALTIDTPARAYPLIVAYLRRMYRVALEEIQGSGYLEDQIRWCLTIPAIWDDQEKQLMRDAAEEAGLPAVADRLLLTIEPEAAALHCEAHLARVLDAQGEQVNPLEAGRRFTVVDCGGGTVDITSYRVERRAGDKTRLAQIARAVGGKLGSEYINQAFIDTVLEQRFGGPGVIARIRAECPHALGELVDAWESYKVTAEASVGADGDPMFERPVFLIIPGEIGALLDGAARERLAAAGGSAFRLAVSPEESRRLFDSVTVDIVQLVEQQLDDVRQRDGHSGEPERLLLVGGLSSSPYLQLRLQQHFAGKAAIMVPTDPAGAVLFGAVAYGCDPSKVSARVTRYTYGVGVNDNFRPGLDPDSKRFMEEGRALCRDRFAVFVQNGDVVETSDVVTHTFHPTTAEQTAVNFSVYRSTERRPSHVDEPRSEQIGRLQIELGEAMKLPRDRRGLEVRFRFGDTEIDVEAINVHTREQADIALRFDATY